MTFFSFHIKIGDLTTDMKLSAAQHRPEPTRLLNGTKLTDHRFDVPLDHANPAGESIEIFAREIALKDAPEDLPWMVFFQGGPGGESPRPMAAEGWVGEVIKTHRLLLLDQRGVGLSTPIMPQTLATRGDAQAQVDYLTHFRTDSIIRDAEMIRMALIGDKKWKGMGQSYGGFCLLTYLSFHPEGLSGVIITGGVACIKRKIKENYRLTYQKVIDKNKLFYRRYPEDTQRAKEVADYLQNNEVMMDDGVRLSVRRFQQLGMFFGGGSGLETMHYLLEKAFINGVNGRELSKNFVAAVRSASSFENSTIFTIMHESIYAEGYATQWAAEQLREEFPEFNTDADDFFFTGEMVAPSMLDDHKSLQELKPVADLLAEKSDWGKLYDLDQLASNTVPISAISYYDDMYVPVEWSEETAQHTGNFRIWVTNEWEHNGIGVAGSKIIARLLNQLEEPAPFGSRG